MRTCLLGLDIGSSSVKASVLDATTGKCVTSAQSPSSEMEILAPFPGWAEQNPETWWIHLKNAIEMILKSGTVTAREISAVGISYQMHGLVCVNQNLEVVRNAIIWCDSRAVDIGNRALKDLGKEKCLTRLLNSPGNFTASKLRWVMDNEPDITGQIFKFMLPGDWIALKLTGQVTTTQSGLSEGIFWDFQNREIAGFMLDYYSVNPEWIPEVVPTFGIQGSITAETARETGLPEGIPVSYRAGDQPNNALSLNVLNPGEIAATAGTSGVVYGVTDKAENDPLSRVNTFLHVNHTFENPRHGILLCINGSGIMNAWIRKLYGSPLSYEEMNRMASEIPTGSDGLVILPFGNGAERMLENRDTAASIHGIRFNNHTMNHLIRAGQEGIAFAFHKGIQIMRNLGMDINIIRAGHSNMFLSPVFCETLAAISAAEIELFNTDGSLGAARGAGIGAGIFPELSNAFKGLEKIRVYNPPVDSTPYTEAYKRWEKELKV